MSVLISSKYWDTSSRSTLSTLSPFSPRSLHVLYVGHAGYAELQTRRLVIGIKCKINGLRYFHHSDAGRR
jgi:hypothetical protein